MEPRVLLFEERRRNRCFSLENKGWENYHTFVEKLTSWSGIMEIKRNLAFVSRELEVLSRYYRVNFVQKRSLTGRVDDSGLSMVASEGIYPQLPSRFGFSSTFSANNLLVFTPWCWGAHSFLKQPSIDNFID